MPIDFQASGQSPGGGTRALDFRPAARPPKREPNFFDRFAEGGEQFLKGAAKGVGSTLFGLAKLGEGVANKTGLAGLTNRIFGGEAKPIDLGEKPKVLEPEGTLQQVGFGAEQIAEFLLPSGAIKAGSQAVKAATGASKLPFLGKAAVNVAGRAVLEGAGAGAVRAAQTGDVKEGAEVGALAGGISGILGTAGAALKATGLSEKLYSQIFRNTADDMTEALRTGALKDLQQKFPEKFAEYVKEGIVKVGADGAARFDPTLAREALDRGLRGSLKNMSGVVVQETLNLEQKARQLAATAPATLKIPEPDKYVNLLKQIQAQYKGTFLESRAAKADEFIKALEGGELSGELTLELRRFLDRMRVASSYRPNIHLSISQEDFKAATDTLRGVLSKGINGMSGVMNDYRFYIEALESLAREAAKRKNAAVINLIDTALWGFGGQLAGPQGAAAFPLIRRATTIPSVVTGLGSKIERGTEGGIGRLFRGAAVPAVTRE